MGTTSTETAGPARRLTSEEFRDVIGRFASGVTVITTSVDGEPYGTTASAVTSLSLEPPMVLVCMSQRSSTGQAMLRAGAFAINILGEADGELAARFATKSPDKFVGVQLAGGDHGQPVLSGALAHLVCRTKEQVTAGTHVVFIAEVDAATGRPGRPLAYFRGQFGRLELADDGPRTVADVQDARRAIEIGAAELSVGSVSAEALLEMRRRMEDTLRPAAGERILDAERWALADQRFHEHMVGLTGSEALLATYRRLGGASLDGRASQEQLADEGHAEDHRRLVEAYEAGDLDLAREVIHRHSDRVGRLRERGGA